MPVYPSVMYVDSADEWTIVIAIVTLNESTVVNTKAIFDDEIVIDMS